MDDAPPSGCRDLLVRQGTIYTVAYSFDWFGEEGLLFDEIKPKYGVGWHAWRFRPVVDRKTDISIFTQMLNPKPCLTPTE